MFSVKMETEQRFHNSNKRYDIERRIFYSCDNQVLIVRVAAISLVTGKKPKISVTLRPLRNISGKTTT